MDRVKWLEELFKTASDKIDEYEKVINKLEKEKDALLEKIEELSICKKQVQKLNLEVKDLERENTSLKLLLRDLYNELSSNKSQTSKHQYNLNDDHPYYHIDDNVDDNIEDEDLVNVDKEIKKESSGGLRNLISETLKRNLNNIDKYA